ncbi:CHAT domain-containing protein [Nocardia nepalensis]|uniref:CHAT domain-containing protein n=1 Tax=Nocardia nepalensis TaxID=3375448 RepID=UPI003B67CACD
MSYNELLRKLLERILTHNRGETIDTAILDDTALDDAAAELWSAAQPTDPDHPSLEDSERLVVARNILGTLHTLRYMVLPDGPDVQELARAIVLVEPIAHLGIEAIPEVLHNILGEAADPVAQADLAARIRQYAETTTDPVLLDVALNLLTSALAATHTAHPDRAWMLSTCGVAYRMRYEQRGGLDDLDRAVQVGEEAVAAAPVGHSERMGALSNLGLAYQVRYERFGGRDDVDRAIAVGEQAVAVGHPDHISRAGALSNLGLAYRMRFRSLGSRDDLDRAIEIGEQAALALPSDDANRSAMLANLGDAYQTRLERYGDYDDLNRAIEVSRQAVTAVPVGHPAHAVTLTSLSHAHLRRFERLGGRDDLDRAVELGEQALAATPVGHTERAGMLASLGAVFHTRFTHSGVLAHLERAVDICEQAVTATPHDHPNRAQYLSNLGNAYQSRFTHSGVLADMDRAIEVGEQAVTATPHDHPDRAQYLSNLGNAYLARHDQRWAPADLDRAIEVGRQAVIAASHDYPDRAKYLSNLGNAYRTRYERHGIPDDLDQAIQAGEQAVAATRTDHPDRAIAYTNLGNSYLLRYERHRAPADIDRAIETGRQAVSTLSADHPGRAVMLSNLAYAYQVRLNLGGQAVDRETLHTLADQVAAAVTAPPVHRVRAGSGVGFLAHAVNEHRLAATVLDGAVALMPSVVSRESQWADQEHRLGRHLGLVGEAIAAHCALNDTVGAVEVSELGRGVLLAAQLDSRTDLTDLDRAHHDLAERFRRVRAMLNTDRTPDNAPGGATARATDWIGERRRWWTEHDELLKQIRQRDGFDRFLLPPRLSDLHPALAEGTAIMVNAGRNRSDAIVIGADTDPVAVRLPDLAFADVVAHTQMLLDASEGDSLVAMLRRRRVIPEILGWLWDAVVHPVLRTGLLPARTDASLPRVWWLPIGLLGLFPLHAAGHDGHPGALDTVISSYVPTLRALVHARGRAPATVRRQLTVALHHTPGLPDLPGTVDEATSLHAHHPDIPLLLDDSATTDHVLAALPRASWAHFACHASVDFTAPSRGGLRLHNGTLSLPEISRLQLAEAELVYLSACSTAHRGIGHADESLHPASAFHLAGFRHVIASLWPLADDIAAISATDFYEHLPPTPTADHAAVALHRTSRSLRAQYPDRPDLWAALIHSGP